MAANKSDLFDKERVSEERARKFAEEIGATFKLTSACTSAGVEELFISCGCRFLDPNYKEDEEGAGANTAGKSGNTGGAVKLDANKAKESTKKKGCC